MTGVKLPCHRNISRACVVTAGIDLDHLTEVTLASSLLCEALFPAGTLPLWKAVTQAAHTRGWVGCRGGAAQTLGNPSVQACLFSPVTCLFSHLRASVWNCRCSLYGSGCGPTLLCFFSCSNRPALAVGSWPRCPFDVPHPFVFGARAYCLALKMLQARLVYFLFPP